MTWDIRSLFYDFKDMFRDLFAPKIQTKRYRRSLFQTLLEVSDVIIESASVSYHCLRIGDVGVNFSIRASIIKLDHLRNDGFEC